MQQRGQDVGAALVTDRQAPIREQPGQGPLDLPAMAAQPCRGVDPAPGDPRGDAPSAQQPPAAREVVAFVGVQLGRALAWSPWPTRGPSTAGTASTSCPSSCESWVLAVDNPTANGIPVASISR
jgi:hypothetical protein